MEWVPTGNRFSPLQADGEPSQVGGGAAGEPPSAAAPSSPSPIVDRPVSARASPALRRSLQDSFSQSRREQPAATPARPAVVVRTSPLGAIAPQLVSFDYDVQGEAFGFEFTRHFGDSGDSSPPSPIRVHVVLLRSRDPTA